MGGMGGELKVAPQDCEYGVAVAGASSRSCSIRLLLGSVCWQLATVFGIETSFIPDDYPGLVEHFHCLLQVKEFVESG